jgi:hypothetical protein
VEKEKEPPLTRMETSFRATLRQIGESVIQELVLYQGMTSVTPKAATKMKGLQPRRTTTSRLTIILEPLRSS